MSKDVIECKDCWWFCFREKIDNEKGQCIAYGFWIEPHTKICCEFERGR
ncbi:hypothetical protein [uncultured Methanobrevibacter sp.]|nr:hypothetical protein [uncultured Methanobrevibacter sp.]